MLSHELRQWALASAGVFCLSAIGYRVITFPAIPDLRPTVANVNAATGEWSKASAAQAKSVTAIERDIRAELWHVDRTLVTADGTLQATTGAIDTANTQLTHIAPVLDAARGSIEQVGPAVIHITADADQVTASTSAAVTDLRALINAPSITATLGNVQTMTDSWAGISGDARKVADKTTADYLKPVPWYLWPTKRAGEILDITSAVARHIP